MNYLVISDGLHYKIAELVENYKNHSIVKFINDPVSNQNIQSQKKIKQNQIIYTLDSNTDTITSTIDKIIQLSSQIDIQLLAELMDDTSKVIIDELAQLYFGDNADIYQKTALLIKLASDNVLFHNYQDGSFRKCTAEEQTLRLHIAQKQERATQEFNYYTNIFNQALTSGNSIETLDNIDIFRLLHKPDKHSSAYKALHHIAQELKITPLELCCNVGLVKNLADFFTQCFIYDNYSKGIHQTYPIHAEVSSKTTDSQAHDSKVVDSKVVDLQVVDLQVLDLQVFSIDDANTTEIDDAFSVEFNSDGYTIGIHIAAPALDAELAQMAVDNISTVYCPNNKFTMFPEHIVQKYSLWENRTLPVVSIYFKVDPEFNILNYHSTVNMVKIAANLRIEELEIMFNQDNLENDHGYPFENELKLLYKFALKLEENRGKPSTNSSFIDYNFGFDGDKIIIKPRIRGNPIDKLVSELMILANCSWGRLLTNAFVPAIYRVKQHNYPVKSTLNPGSHVGLNVDYYTWASSPLRRATDYINQRQIINLVLYKKEYYTAIDPILLGVVDNFDTTYAKYLEFQKKMEHYWSLKYLVQEQINEISATFMYKTTAQLDGLPVEIDLTNLTTPKARGTKVKLKIYNVNLAALHFDFKIIETQEINQTQEQS